MKLYPSANYLGFIFITLFSGFCVAAEEWMWHGAFPWVYSHDNEDWTYWRTGQDGRFYKWSKSSGGWQIYNEGEEAWKSLTAPDLNDTKWQAWEQNPQPYGGLYTLDKIKNAILNSLS